MIHYFWDLMRYMERMGLHEWFWVLAAVFLVSALCLRGFGSRSQY